MKHTKKTMATALKLSSKLTNYLKIAPLFLFAVVVSCSDDSMDESTTITSTTNTLLQKSNESVQLNDHTTGVMASTEQDDNSAFEAMDGNTNPDSRWSGYGASATLDIDLKTVDFVDYIKIMFLKGDERQAKFEVYAKPNNASSWTKINTKTSSGDHSGFEIFDLNNTDTRFLRILGKGNSLNGWNSIIELEVWGTPGSGITEEFEEDEDEDEDEDTDGNIGDYNLDSNKAPSENFDLSEWKITLSSGDEVKVAQLNNKFIKSNQFYTDPNDGGMVFKNYPKGSGTTTSSSYSRVEFREMLRSYNDDIDATGINRNNWVLNTSSSSSKSKSGGIDGTLMATLKVNRVTDTSDEKWQVGRIIIGQIHAEKNEPCRLYYHKQPNHRKGALYFAHEQKSGEERFYNLIGHYVDESDLENGWKYNGAGEPSNGIALDAEFSYKIDARGNSLDVVIYDKDGHVIASKNVNMGGSDYANSWMYFKAGVYSGNKTVQSSSDYEKATFYSLTTKHY